MFTKVTSFLQDKQWAESKLFTLYEPPPSPESDGSFPVGAKEEWLERMKFLLSDIEWLLGLQQFRYALWSAQWSNSDSTYNEQFWNCFLTGKFLLTKCSLDFLKLHKLKMTKKSSLGLKFEIFDNCQTRRQYYTKYSMKICRGHLIIASIRIFLIGYILSMGKELNFYSKQLHLQDHRSCFLSLCLSKNITRNYFWVEQTLDFLKELLKIYHKCW